MKAVVVAETGGPEVLRLQDVEDPRPSDTQVVIEVAACGMCGHDQADRMGLTTIPLPEVLGHEVAGTIVEVGAKVRRFAAGERVAIKQFTTCGHCRSCLSGDELRCPEKAFNYGGYSELMAVDESAVLPIPDRVSFADAAVTACAVGTCYQALVRIADLRPGENVVVTGAGGGLGGVSIAMTSSPDKVDQLKLAGADHVVVSGKQAWQDLLDLTGGMGVDVVIDNVGVPGIFSSCFRGMRHAGRYVFTGQMTGDRVGIFPAFVFGKEAVITGSASTLMSSFIASLDLVASGAVRPVTRSFPMDDVVVAFTAVDERTVTGRAVLIPGVPRE